MFAQIRHVAIYTENYDRLATFYKTAFGMRQITSGMSDETGRRNPKRGFLGDGIIELAMLRKGPGVRSGLDHFGFEVEDTETALERIRRDFPDVMVRESLSTVPFAERRVHEPLGVSFDISQKGAIKSQATRYLPDYNPEGWDQPRHFNHIAIRSAKAERTVEFFKKVFELSEVPDYDGEGICLTDGKSYLIVRPCTTTTYDSMKPCIEHIGFKVEDLGVARKELDDIAQSFPQSAVQKIVEPDRLFGENRQKEMEGCALGKYAVSDPEGILLDLLE